MPLLSSLYLNIIYLIKSDFLAIYIVIVSLWYFSWIVNIINSNPLIIIPYIYDYYICDLELYKFYLSK